MDTDDLTDETYKAIIIEADKFSHDLTLQFGLLSGDCENEAEFIEQSILLIDEMKTYDEVDLYDMFFGNPPDQAEFQAALARIIHSINELK